MIGIDTSSHHIRQRLLQSLYDSVPGVESCFFFFSLRLRIIQLLDIDAKRGWADDSLQTEVKCRHIRGNIAVVRDCRLVCINPVLRLLRHIIVRCKVSAIKRIRF